MNRKGFTLIELILVIAILGILAVSALPKFLDMTENADISAMQGTAGAVRSGIALYKANQLVTGGTGVYPTTLAANFSTVLDNPVGADEGWTGSTAVYTYNHGSVNAIWTYDSAAGTFTCAGDCN